METTVLPAPSAESAEASAENSVAIVFDEGIIGVPRARRFQLLERKGSPVRFLRCLDVPRFALPIVDPRLADPDYSPDLGSRVADTLGLEPGDGILVFAVATLDPSGTTANLRAPVVINTRKRLATQVILDDRHYPLRAPLRTGG